MFLFLKILRRFDMIVKEEVIIVPRKKHTGGYADRDIDVMNILWNSEKSLTASEIVSARPELELTVNTVQAIFRYCSGIWKAEKSKAPFPKVRYLPLFWNQKKIRKKSRQKSGNWNNYWRNIRRKQNNDTVFIFHGTDGNTVL